MAVFSVPSTFSLNVLRRLVEAGAPPGERHQALALLSLLVAQMRPQSYEAEPSLSDLAAQFGALRRELRLEREMVISRRRD